MALFKLKKGASRLAYPPSFFPADFHHALHLRHADGIACNRESAPEALNVRAKQMVVSMNVLSSESRDKACFWLC